MGGGGGGQARRWCDDILMIAGLGWTRVFAYSCTAWKSGERVNGPTTH